MRLVWPVFERSCLRSRSVATAVKRRVPTDTVTDPVAPAEWSLPRQSVIPNKWAIPTSQRNTRAHPEHPSAGSQSKWARALPSASNPSGGNPTFQSRHPSSVLPFQRDHVLPSQPQRSTQRATASRITADTGAGNKRVGFRQPSRTTSFTTNNKPCERSDHHDTRPGRPNRTSHKARGSLVLQDEEDESLQPLSKSPKKVTKKIKFIEKKITADIYIPSLVSVGTLARLLGIRLRRAISSSNNSGFYFPCRTFAASHEAGWHV